MTMTENAARFPERHLHEECGVFGVYSESTADVASLAYYALYALQHRGQESAGIAVNDDGVFSAYRDVGLVSDVFPREASGVPGDRQHRRGPRALRHHRLRQQAQRPAHPGEPTTRAAWPWPTTAISPTPMSCGRNWRAGAPSSRPPRTPRSSPTSSCRNG